MESGLAEWGVPQNEEEVAMKRLRGIRDTALYFKREDPDTKITEYFLRRLVKEGKIPSVMLGKKLLINLDDLIEYLNMN